MENLFDGYGGTLYDAIDEEGKRFDEITDLGGNKGNGQTEQLFDSDLHVDDKESHQFYKSDGGEGEERRFDEITDLRANKGNGQTEQLFDSDLHFDDEEFHQFYKSGEGEFMKLLHDEEIPEEYLTVKLNVGPTGVLDVIYGQDSMTSGTKRSVTKDTIVPASKKKKGNESTKKSVKGNKDNNKEAKGKVTELEVERLPTIPTLPLIGVSLSDNVKAELLELIEKNVLKHVKPFEFEKYVGSRNTFKDPDTVYRNTCIWNFQNIHARNKLLKSCEKIPPEISEAVLEAIYTNMQAALLAKQKFSLQQTVYFYKNPYDLLWIE